MDALRETAFSGLGSFYELEEPKTGGRRLFLLVVLLAALGVAGWWTYTNYLTAMQGPKPPAATSAGDNAAEKPTTTAGKNDTTPEAAKAPSQTTATDPETTEAKPAQEGPDSTARAARVEPKPAIETKPEPPPALAPKVASAEKNVPKREKNAAPAKPASASQADSVDSADAAFRKGEAYLYGRGVAENCNEAVRYLKMASNSGNAKARSAFGTMYATGHCVSRDLPTSYSWFALALRADPNNQILEKDLSAVWNQMTPPEKQLATRIKQ